MDAPKLGVIYEQMLAGGFVNMKPGQGVDPARQVPAAIVHASSRKLLQQLHSELNDYLGFDRANIFNDPSKLDEVKKMIGEKIAASDISDSEKQQYLGKVNNAKDVLKIYHIINTHAHL